MANQVLCYRTASCPAIGLCFKQLSSQTTIQGKQDESLDLDMYEIENKIV